MHIRPAFSAIARRNEGVATEVVFAITQDPNDNEL